MYLQLKIDMCTPVEVNPNVKNFGKKRLTPVYWFKIGYSVLLCTEDPPQEFFSSYEKKGEKGRTTDLLSILPTPNSLVEHGGPSRRIILSLYYLPRTEPPSTGFESYLNTWFLSRFKDLTNSELNKNSTHKFRFPHWNHSNLQTPIWSKRVTLIIMNGIGLRFQCRSISI